MIDARTIALVSKSSATSQADLAAHVPLYREYVDAHLAPRWHVHASFVADGSVPPGAIPFTFQDALDTPGEAGYHTDVNGQPLSVIDASRGPDDALFTGSHELAETLKDPLGLTVYAAPSPDPADGGRMASILLELGDPVEALQFAVVVQGKAMSDFILHTYGGGPDRRDGARYDETGALRAPRTVATDGYLSYVIDGVWRQVTNFGDQWAVRTLGPAGAAAAAGMSLREWVGVRGRELNVADGRPA